jgi:hypothetical protein
MATSNRRTKRDSPSTDNRFRLLLAVGDASSWTTEVSGGGGTAWMLVRPGSEEVIGVEAEDSFGEFMKLRSLREKIPRTELQKILYQEPGFSIQLNHPPNPMLLFTV